MTVVNNIFIHLRNKKMDIWSWIIVSLIVLIAILIVVDTLLRQNKERDQIRPLYAVINQTKEYIRFVSTFHEHIGKIKNQFPLMNERDLVKINISLLRRSWALAVVTQLRAEKIFDYLKKFPLTNSAVSIEDRESIDDILKEAYGDDFDKYDIDLNDDSLDSIHKILETETN